MTATAHREIPTALWRQKARQFSRSWLATLAVATFGVFAMAAVLAPIIAPQNPYDLTQVELLDSVLPPGAASADGKLTYWLGTDSQGRDMLSAIIYGLRVSLEVGASATVLALAIGASIGVAVTYIGGWVEALVMRIVDLQLSFPAILIALILSSVFGKGVDKVIISLVAVQWAYYARATRSCALAEKQKDYVGAAQGLAIPVRRILLRHLLPNCLPPLIVVATIQVAYAIALEATLSFLGAGVPVTEPSLGLLIKNGYDYLLSGKYWISTFPGIALLALIVSINIAGDRLRDVLNPRLQK